MASKAIPPLVEAFLILDQPRQRLSHWTRALGPLDDARAPALATVAAYYDPTCDQALLALRYDELALGGERLAFVVEVALLAEIGMIQPSELSDGDRRRFLGERLARCTVQVGHQRNVVGALAELVRCVREQRPRPRAAKPPSAAPSPSLSMYASTPGGGLVAIVDPLLVPPRPTRDDLGELAPARRGPPPIPAQARTSSRHVIARAGSPRLRPPEPPPGARPVNDLALLPRGSQETFTAEPYAPPTATLPPGSIYARYLRSGRWVPIRVGALSLRGAALMAGALPRVHDRVEVAFAFADQRAIVRGPVHKVSTREEAVQRGATSFDVAFELDDDSRRGLTALLQAARAAKVTIKPPPARGDRRYPVEWPVCLGTIRGAIRGDALDVSREGMFVRPANALALDASLGFSIGLDDPDGPVSGRARVVRFLDEADARSCGLAPGYGLRIVDMPELDRARWAGFLARIERRAERRVLIGAAPGRLRELQGGLAAAGYAAAGATDPEALVQLASRDERAVDACLIDAGWLPPGRAGTWSEALFPARNVPCVAMRGDVRRAREAIDQVLSIV